MANMGIAWNYGLAAFGTLLTLLPLLSLLPPMPPLLPREHPLRALLSGFTFLF